MTKIFIECDDFMQEYGSKIEQYQLSNAVKRDRKGRLSTSEIMSILIYFHISRYRSFKDYYMKLILTRYKGHFPNIVSYNRFIELIRRVWLPLCLFTKICKRGKEGSIYDIDSTTIKVCHQKRINSHKVFKGLATRGKTSMGWFYGFKLHLVINGCGEIVSFVFSKANVDDRDEDIIMGLTKSLQGKLIGDKGYLKV